MIRLGLWAATRVNYWLDPKKEYNVLCKIDRVFTCQHCMQNTSPQGGDDILNWVCCLFGPWEDEIATAGKCNKDNGTNTCDNDGELPSVSLLLLLLSLSLPWSNLTALGTMMMGASNNVAMTPSPGELDDPISNGARWVVLELKFVVMLGFIIENEINGAVDLLAEEENTGDVIDGELLGMEWCFVPPWPLW